MLITKRFVFIHLPKTGGTFAKNALENLYIPQAQVAGRLVRQSNHILSRTKAALGIQPNFLSLSKHGYRHEIPEKYVPLPILACMRNPFDWYVSNYKYQFWRTHPKHYPGIRQHPKWPDLAFEDYMQLSMNDWLTLRNREMPVNRTLGRLTTLFINWYCQNPDALLVAGKSDDEIERELREAIAGVHFLDTKNLNQDLYDYLFGIGHSAENLSFILDKNPISPRGLRSTDEKWPDFYSSDLMACVQSRDRILFRIFPNYLPAKQIDR